MITIIMSPHTSALAFNEEIMANNKAKMIDDARMLAIDNWTFL